MRVLDNNLLFLCFALRVQEGVGSIQGRFITRSLSVAQLQQLLSNHVMAKASKGYT